MNGGILAHMLVDANIARSAADPARHPTTIASLRLARILEKGGCKTRIIMTPLLKAEWRKHASAMMTRWLLSMEQRGGVRHERDRSVRDLRDAVETVDDRGIRSALEKDFHITEPAILFGAAVASLDDRQRRYLKLLSDFYQPAGNIQWVNPERDQDWHEWVMEGCVDASSFRIRD